MVLQIVQTTRPGGYKAGYLEMPFAFTPDNLYPRSMLFNMKIFIKCGFFSKMLYGLFFFIIREILVVNLKMLFSCGYDGFIFPLGQAV